MSERTRGFEDAVELCLSAVIKARNLEEAKEIISNYLGLLKEKKFDMIERELGQLA